MSKREPIRRGAVVTLTGEVRGLDTVFGYSTGGAGSKEHGDFRVTQHDGSNALRALTVRGSLTIENAPEPLKKRDRVRDEFASVGIVVHVEDGQAWVSYQGLNPARVVPLDKLTLVED